MTSGAKKPIGRGVRLWRVAHSLQVRAIDPDREKRGRLHPSMSGEDEPLPVSRKADLVADCDPREMGHLGDRCSVRTDRVEIPDAQFFVVYCAERDQVQSRRPVGLASRAEDPRRELAQAAAVHVDDEQRPSWTWGSSNTAMFVGLPTRDQWPTTEESLDDGSDRQHDEQQLACHYPGHREGREEHVRVLGKD